MANTSKEIAQSASPKVTVCIPTYNGEEFLKDVLNGVFLQKCSFDYEVLVIDSGSSDKTLDIIAKFPKARLHQIPNSEFGHGKTRNLAAQLANGEIMVYLTQDAVPATKKWLEYMIEPFAISPKVVCVFGKQIPRVTCVAPLKREIMSAFNALGPDHSLMIHRGTSLVSDQKFKHTLTFFSDVNSAVKRDLLLNTIPFRDVAYSEDQALGVDVLKAGYLKAYTPFGAVYHSHDYPLKKYFHRKYDEYVGLQKTVGHVLKPSIRHMLYAIFRMSVADYLFILRDPAYSWKRKLYNLAVSPLYNIALQQAIRLSFKSERYHEKLSLEARMKKKE